jgi:hypothetical protein
MIRDKIGNEIAKRDKIGDEITKRFEPTLDVLCNLYDRWSVEREYEDWNDYVDLMKKLPLPEGAKFVRASKKPFGFYVRTGNGGFLLFATQRKAGWKIVETIA